MSVDVPDSEQADAFRQSGGAAIATALRRWAVRLAALIILVALWQAASASKAWVIVNFAYIPSPREAAQEAWDYLHSSNAPHDVGSSLVRIFSGFGLAAILGIPTGVVIGRFRWARDTLLVPLEILRPIPAVAWIPLAILMFHTAEQSMTYICFVGAFYPILLGTIHGVESLDRRLIYAAQSLGAGTWSIFREVIVPGAFPSIVTGLSIGMGTAWFSLVTAEMIAGQFGIGYHTWESYTLQNYPGIVVGMLFIGVLGMGSSVAVRFIGNRLMPWRRHGGHNV
jgi:NitT/TauT family transport system permease protein